MLQVSIQKQLKHSRFRFLCARFRGITVLWGRPVRKTTLLQCLAGLLRPDAGRIACREAVWFDAEQGALAPERRRIGYVFQDVRLFPHLSVRSNMLFGRRFRPSGYRSKTWSRFWVWDGCCTARLPIRHPEAKTACRRGARPAGLSRAAAHG